MSTSSTTATVSKYKLVILNDPNLTATLNAGSFRVLKLKHPKMNEQTPFILVEAAHSLHVYELMSYSQEMGSLFVNDYVQSECGLFFSSKLNLSYFLIDFVSTTSQKEFASRKEFDQKLAQHLFSAKEEAADKSQSISKLVTTIADSCLKEFCDVKEEAKKMQVTFNMKKCVAWLSKKIEALKVYLAQTMTSTITVTKIKEDPAAKDKEEARIGMEAFELIAQYVNKSVAEALRQELGLSDSKIKENDNGVKRQCITLN